jgi:deoxyhypusine synthase
MKQFINLSSRIINKSHIVEILKKLNKYEICMANKNNEGFMFVGSGAIYTKHNIIEICAVKNKSDYEIITNLIKQEV